MSGEPIDPWTNVPSFRTGTEPRQNTVPKDFLNVTHHDLPVVEPDGDWISPLLGSIVFPTKDAPDLRTYLCLDATLRTNLVGLFDLDVTDADVRCLFTGEAEDKWKESAPYLVDITPDAKNSDGTNFCQQFFSEHWGKGTGIILITPAPMHAVWRHLRRFTRVRQSDSDGWSLFRFWDPRVALPYFSGIRRWGDRSHRFFEITGTQEKLSMVIEHSGGTACTQITASEHFDEAVNDPLPPFVLTQDDLVLLKGGVRYRFVTDVAEQSTELWPHIRAKFSSRHLWHAEIDRIIGQAHDAGLTLDRDIRDYIAITLDKGAGFWSRADVLDILKKPHLNTPSKKVLALRSKLEAGALT